MVRSYLKESPDKLFTGPKSDANLAHLMLPETFSTPPFVLLAGWAFAVAPGAVAQSSRYRCYVQSTRTAIVLGITERTCVSLHFGHKIPYISP